MGEGRVTQPYQLVIDVGTCHTVAVIRRAGQLPRPVLFDGAPLLPSGVYLDDDGSLMVGHDAERLSLLRPNRYEPHPKRCVDDGTVLLGDTAVPVAELLGALVRRVAAEASTDGPPQAVTMTCPADWGPPRREVLRAAARVAGLPEVWLVDEPIAAATYCVEVLGYPIPPGQPLVVFDFGGGTLDVTVVRRDPGGLSVLATGGLDDLGGVDVDAALIAHLGQLVALRQPDRWARLFDPQGTGEYRDRRAFWNDVRAAKEMLSRTATAPVPVPGSDEVLHVTREELERVARPLVDRTVDETQRVVERARLPTDALAGILLVGGSSRIPLVASRLHARFGVAPVTPEQAELPVAYGAGLVTAPTPTSPAPTTVSAWTAGPAPQWATGPPPMRPTSPVWAAPPMAMHGPVVALPARRNRTGLIVTVVALVVLAVIIVTCCRGCYSFLDNITVVDPSSSASASASTAASGAVTVRSAQTRLCLDFADTRQGAVAQQDTCSGDPAQTWTSSPTTSPGTVALTNVVTAQCLDVDQGSVDDGAKVQQWPCDNGTNQAWQLTPLAGSTAVLLVNLNSGKCLTVSGKGQPTPGTVLVQETCTSAAGQQWNVGP